MPAHDTQAHTASALALMQTLKRSLDPKNILNRGKVLPVGGTIAGGVDARRQTGP